MVKIVGIDQGTLAREYMRMPKANVIQEKSYAFAVHTALFCKKIMEEQKEYVISKQLMKSGTSIGANVEEGLHAESKADFIHKLSIALKEAHETHFWLRLLRDTHIVSSMETQPLLQKIQEILALLTAIITSSKRPSPCI